MSFIGNFSNDLRKAQNQNYWALGLMDWDTKSSIDNLLTKNIPTIDNVKLTNIRNIRDRLGVQEGLICITKLPLKKEEQRVEVVNVVDVVNVEEGAQNVPTMFLQKKNPHYLVNGHGIVVSGKKEEEKKSDELLDSHSMRSLSSSRRGGGGGGGRSDELLDSASLRSTSSSRRRGVPPLVPAPPPPPPRNQEEAIFPYQRQRVTTTPTKPKIPPLECDPDFHSRFSPYEMRCLALIATNHTYPALLQFIKTHKNLLRKFRITGTQVIMQALAEVLGQKHMDEYAGPVCNPAAFGGAGELMAQLSTETIGGCIIFQDPIDVERSYMDVATLTRHLNLHNVMVATNPCSAHLMTFSLRTALQIGESAMIPSFFATCEHPSVVFVKERLAEGHPNRG